MVQDTASIEVFNLGINNTPVPGFEIEGRGPFPFYTFSYYNCPVALLDRNGINEYEPGVSLMLAPEDHRFVKVASTYRTSTRGLLDTWFHFAGPGVEACVEKYGISTNEVFDLGELPFLKPIMEEVRNERTHKFLYWEAEVADLVREFLRELGSVISDVRSQPSQARVTAERHLRDIRARVHSDLAHRWTVAEMAASGGMRPGWFATLYTKQFGVSPVDDLLDARLRLAEALLTRGPMSVADIAANCGFSNVEHFTRLFRKRMGYTPGQIRRKGTSRIDQQN